MKIVKGKEATDKMAVAIIPARGGSKGIPGKNLINFSGKPLLAWSILQAKAAQHVSQVYVSSDDDQIIAVAKEFGAVPIRRPAELATDTSSSEEALQHALVEISKGGSLPALIVFLQATSPLREPEDIDGAISRLLETGADSLFSAALLEDFCIWKKEGGSLHGLTYDPCRRGVRQDREPLFLENGSIYVFRVEVLEKYNNRLGGQIEIFEMPFWKSYEIDTMAEVEICEYYFKKNELSRSVNLTGENWTIHLEDIDLMVYDFDGVMTDNRVLVLQDGSEGVMANRADGLGVEKIRALGIKQIILSTETNDVVKARAAKLKLDVIAGCQDKKDVFHNYCLQHGYDLNRVVYVGNDVNDLEVMKIIGFPVAPADAHPEVQRVAKALTRAKGGEGVIKDLAERIV